MISPLSSDVIAFCNAHFVPLQIYGFRSSSPSGGKVATPDFEYIALGQNRVIYICPDGDVRTNFAVWQGVQRMAGVIRLWDKDGTTQIKMLLLPLNPAGKPPGIDDWLHASPSATEETLLGLTVNIGDTAPPEGYRTYESVKVEIEEIFAVLSERNTILGSRIMEEIKPATWGKARTARTR